MIRDCTEDDFAAIHAIVNDAAEAYRGVIPADCWPPGPGSGAEWSGEYMPADELAGEIAAGVRFLGFAESGELLGIMGVQDVAAEGMDDVTLIRHAYVRGDRQNQGIGGALIAEIRARARTQAGTRRPLLIGTWAAADWAVSFYQKRGFRLVSEEEKDRLLAAYWTIPARQIETSVVLTDAGG